MRSGMRSSRRTKARRRRSRREGEAGHWRQKKRNDRGESSKGRKQA